MAVADIIREFRKTSPATAYEMLYFSIILLIGVMILFNPDSIGVLNGIDPDPIIADAPGWSGLLLTLGAPNLLLITMFAMSIVEDDEEMAGARDQASNEESDDNADDKEENEEEQVLNEDTEN